jgi:type I restriction enzyme S subunit
MSETLEAMARALFKSWFVDFDPVRAKMNLPSPSGRGAGGEGTKPAMRANAPIPTQFLDFARQLRRQATDAENLLWRLLRGRQIAKAKFRRQHSFPPYILDFYCHELRLAVELDGGQHDEAHHRSRDARRDRYLAEHGIRVLRFWNNEVLSETEAVLEAIYAAVVEQAGVVPSPPAPLPKGEGGYGLPKHLADLFPARLVDSELGEIPEGWRASVLGEEVTRCGGRIQTGPFGSQLHASDYVADGVPVVMPKDLSRRRVSTQSIARVNIDDVERLSRHRLQQGDIVYSRRGDVEQHGLVHRRETGWLCGTGCLLVRPGPKWPSSLWVSIALDRPESRAWIVQHAIGATMPNLNTGILARVPLLVPPDEILRAFDRFARPLADKVISADAQTETLVSLRDALLPKLIGGELRVKDAEKFVDKVV